VSTKARSSPEAPRWGVLLAAGWLGAVLALAGFVDGPISVAVIAAGFGALGMAGWLWGADSRDGQDWGGF
jgi:hypothetical protein